MANGMSALYVGATGLRSAQTALNATSHNLSNLNTAGYTRQQVTFSDTQYIGVMTKSTTTFGNYGLGVNISAIRRIREDFIDSAYRRENSRLGFYESQYKAVEEVEDLFGETQGVRYQLYITNLREAINELSKNPTSTVARSSLIQNATAFIDKSEAVYKGLKDYQTTLNTEVKNMIKKINDLGNTIFKLNKKIAKIEAPNIEQANDLRDARDAALDELSGYVDMQYYESESGEVIVNADDVPFVTHTNVMAMESRVVEGTNLVIPTWPAYKQDVYDFSRQFDNFSDKDKGTLKGLLLARGNINVDYRDVPVYPDKSQFDLTQASGQAEYNKAMDAYKKDQEYYNTYIEPSVILCAIAGIDKLVNGMVESVNNVLCPEKTIESTAEMLDAGGKAIQADLYTYKSSSHAVLFDRYGNRIEGTRNADNTYSYASEEKLYYNNNGTMTAEKFDSLKYTVLDMDKTDYGMDKDMTVGTELFKRVNTERYVQANDGTYVRNNLNVTGYESLYALGNLQMNPVAAQEIDKIPLSTQTGKEDFERANELLATFENKFASLDPQSYAKTDFVAFYDNYIGEFATLGRVLGKFVQGQSSMVNGYNNQRLETEGVSSDEELEKMIKYQHAYNAASRYINVVNEMIEHLVTSLGHV